MIKMKYIQTIENLYNKAQENGEAILNGRMRDFDFGQTYVGDLEEKYYIGITENEVILRHWGTETLRINKHTKEVISWYGESRSDADSMNTLLDIVENKTTYFRCGSKMGFIAQERDFA